MHIFFCVTTISLNISCILKLLVLSTIYGLWSMWSSGQSSWLQTQRHSRHYQIFCEVIGLEQDPLSLVSAIEELLERKRSGSGLEIREYCHRDLSR
jgi:hypothetical protein